MLILIVRTHDVEKRVFLQGRTEILEGCGNHFYLKMWQQLFIVVEIVIHSKENAEKHDKKLKLTYLD